MVRGEQEGTAMKDLIKDPYIDIAVGEKLVQFIQFRGSMVYKLRQNESGIFFVDILNFTTCNKNYSFCILVFSLIYKLPLKIHVENHDVNIIFKGQLP